MNTLHQDFLLSSKLAKELYHEIAAKLPVVDYHNHLNPVAIASNKGFKNITELWIYDDQYKHRLMRINGVSEKYITGEGTDEEKFVCWLNTFKKTMGNPLFHWSQLEIKAIFGEEINLFDHDPYEIWKFCNAHLSKENISAQGILKSWNSEVLCTSDDLLDDIAIHKQITSDVDKLSVFPSLRSDSVIAFDTPGYFNWLERLSVSTDVKIDCLESYLAAIAKRLDLFQNAGCVLSDHGLDSGFQFISITREKAEHLFGDLLDHKSLSQSDITGLKSYMMTFLGIEYGKRNMTMQLHIGAQRQTSSRLKAIAGKFGGFAAIGNPFDIVSICRFLDSLECAGALPNTILYTLNPTDNERMATLTGSFAGDGVTGKIQFGPAWWFNDHYEGIKKQLTDIASYGLINTFIGMTSDSRSFMSLSRHYYFRRILCQLLSSWAEKGLLPQDFEMLAGLVENVCYKNAKNLITSGKI